MPWIALLLCFALESSTRAQGVHEFTATVTQAIKTTYLLYLPADYSTTNTNLPVIVYLHGGSLRGDDVERLRSIGLPRWLESNSTFPFIVIVPLCPTGEIWTDSDTVTGILDDVLRKHRVDRTRVYLTGHSMGARGALYFAFKHPTRFAAMFALSAPAPVNDWSKRLSSIPLWYVHGANDTLAPIGEAESFISALRAAGGDVTYSRLEQRDHFLLDFYEQPDWYKWLLRHTRQ